MNEALLKEYIASLQKRIERLDSLRDKLAEGNLKAEENVRLLAHSLHGSGASFGFPDISEAGKAAEHASPDALLPAVDALKSVLEKVVANNAGVLASPGTPGTGAKSPGSGQPAGQGDATPEEATVIRVLLVEDDADMAALIQRILETLPKKMRIKTVTTAVKAQEAVVKHPYDLIIMDLVLPDRDGREVIQQIKLEFRLDTPLLVLSGIQSDAVRVECMSLGADKFLTKPFFDEELLNEVRKILGKKIKKKLTLVPLEGEMPQRLDEDTGPGPLSGELILVAEDDKMQANLIRHRLMREGAEVKHADNGRIAMQELRSQKYSLVILDVKMPMMDGFEVLQRLRRELRQEIPVIMVTAMGSEEDIIRGYDLGATDYLLKPYSEVQLVARVKSLLK